MEGSNQTIKPATVGEHQILKIVPVSSSHEELSQASSPEKRFRRNFVRARPGRASMIIMVLKQHTVWNNVYSWNHLAIQYANASSSLEELNRAGTLLVNPTAATSTVGWVPCCCRQAARGGERKKQGDCGQWPEVGVLMSMIRADYK